MGEWNLYCAEGATNGQEDKQGKIVVRPARQWERGGGLTGGGEREIGRLAR